jgi:hypothetical protein
MSVPVDVRDLGAHAADRGLVAFLLTTSDDGRPHAVSVSLQGGDGTFGCRVGRRSAANAVARPLVSLLWPARTDDDYSLIVDGDATVSAAEDGGDLVVTPSRAVLHRTAENRSDCVPLDLS